MPPWPDDAVLSRLVQAAGAETALGVALPDRLGHPESPGALTDASTSANADVIGSDAGRALLVVDRDLSRVPRAQLGLALRWLAQTRRRMAVSLSVAPALQDSAATLLAPDVWRRLFEAAGLRVRETVVDEAPVSPGRWRDQWAEADPFRLGKASTCGFLLEAAGTEVVQPVDVVVRTLAGPQHVPRRTGRRIGFLVSSYQDLHLLLPWLDRLDPRDAHVLVRDSPNAVEAGWDLQAACAPYGVPVVKLGPNPMPVLEAANVAVLLLASESAANTSHLSNAVIGLMAREAGLATVHIQHGIWPRAEFPPPVLTGADGVLAWSDEYREVLPVDPRAFHVVGSPRFDRYAGAARRSVAGLYGSWAERFARHVVVATNLHWQQHTRALDAPGALDALAERFTDTLFTWKPHPYEAVVRSSCFRENIVRLSEPVMLAAGIDPGDVVEAADLIVTTPSTFALEAELAGKPCFVVDTGNPSRHDYLDYRPFSELEGWLAADKPESCADARYAGRYCEPVTRGSALDRSLEAIEKIRRRRLPPPAGMATLAAGLYGALALASGENARLRQDFTTASRYAESLSATLREKDAYILYLHGLLSLPAGPAGPADG